MLYSYAMESLCLSDGCCVRPVRIIKWKLSSWKWFFFFFFCSSDPNTLLQYVMSVDNPQDSCLDLKMSHFQCVHFTWKTERLKRSSICEAANLQRLIRKKNSMNSEGNLCFLSLNDWNSRKSDIMTKLKLKISSRWDENDYQQDLQGKSGIDTYI